MTGTRVTDGDREEMTPAEGTGTFRSVLGHRAFGVFMAGQTVSQFGDKLTMMAMFGLIGAMRAGGSGGLELAQLALASSLPVLLFGPVVGVLVDRWNRRTTLIACDAGRATCVMAVPAVHAWSGSLLPIYPIVFVVFLLGMFFNSARMATIPNLVPRGDLLAANAVSTFVGRFATVFGIVLGGVVVSWSGWGEVGLEGYAAGFYLDSASFWISVVTLSVAIPRGVRAPGVPTTTAAPDRERGAPVGVAPDVLAVARRAFRRFLEDVRQALGMIARHRALGFAMSSFVLLAVVGGFMYVVIVDVMQSQTSLGTRGVGLVGGILAGGMIVGSLLQGTVGRRWDRSRTILIGYAVVGGLIAASARPFSAALHVPLAFAGGMALAPIMISQDTLLHEVAPERFRGRIFAAKDLTLGLVFALVAIVTGVAVSQLPLLGVVQPHQRAMSLVGPAVALAGMLAMYRYKPVATAVALIAVLGAGCGGSPEPPAAPADADSAAAAALGDPAPGDSRGAGPNEPVAADHRLPATPATVAWGYYWSEAEPVLTIASGDTVRVDTLITSTPERLEAAGVAPGEVQQSLRDVVEQVSDRGPGGHILTGPIFVEGAEPGDVLDVEVLSVELPIAYSYNGCSGFLPELCGETRTRIIPLDRDAMVGRFGDGIAIPLRPFFGSMGVAPPPSAGRWSSVPPWIHAGNIDNKELVAGTRLLIPVHVEGALFAVGDGHAAQGDGEVDQTALETSLSGVLRLTVRKGRSLEWPRAETDTHYITMGADEDLTEATRIAVREAVRFLEEQRHLPTMDAYRLVSVACDLRITQLVDQKVGVHVMIPKAVVGRG